MDSFFPEYQSCRLCPRRCGVDRTAVAAGVCGETAACRVAHLGPHHGEEPPISGTRGSGTVFFCGCSSHCFFCQNIQISAATGAECAEGRVLTPEALFAEVKALADRDVHNLNFVTPDHFWPHIRELCRRLREADVVLPFLWNGSGYHAPELVPQVAEWMDIFLPDFKFAAPELARFCMGDAAYPEVALASLRAMVMARGFLDPCDPEGMHTARRGVLVRHLVLPGQVENSLRVLDLLHRAFGSELPLSVMSQYRPMPACRGRGEFARGVRKDEYARVCERVEALGFQNVFIQELAAETAFLPDFRADQPFAGNRGSD